jgi:transposase-like protein
MNKRYSADQIVAILRQADGGLGKGLRAPRVCEQIGISEQTEYRWRQKYGGMARGSHRPAQPYAGVHFPRQERNWDMPYLHEATPARTNKALERVISKAL